MRVRMTKTAAGPDWVYMAGETWNLEPALAESLVAAASAVLLDAPAPVAPAVEQATVETPETAMLRPKRGRR